MRKHAPKGLILSGGPSSVYEPGAPKCDPRLFELDVPILGICYGMQLACNALGGHVEPTPDPQSLFYPDLRRTAPTGTVGDPCGASALRGARYVAAWVDALEAALAEKKRT